MGDVKGKDAFIFEDEISTGGTMMTTVKTLHEAGVALVHTGESVGELFT